MKQKLVHVAIIVDDYDKAIDFYTNKLNFTLSEDTILSDTKRWVLVTPKGAKECSLLLAKGVNDEQKSRIGNQSGGRVFLFLNTDNFKRDYKNLIDNNIKIVREPSIETYGTVAVFEDIYGNLWDLIEPQQKMEVKEAYSNWAVQYDTNHNKTRDLEAISIRETLTNINFDNCLEIGCGTGKNTEWLISKANKTLAVDLSNEMLEKAKEKIKSDKVTFIQADILSDWNFTNNEQFDLAVFSLVLEHIHDLDMIFAKLNKAIRDNGYVYIGELHPFKQYNGSKARFDTENGQQIVTCFTHNISDFTNSAKINGFEIIELKEYFDDNDRTNIPRILTILFNKVNPHNMTT